MKEQPKGLFSKRSCPWLLLFVFYLQFVLTEVLNMLWQNHFGTTVPKLLALTVVQIFAVALPCFIFILLKNVKTTEIIKHRKLDFVTALVCIITGMTAQPIAGLINSPVILHIAKANPSSVINTPDSVWSFILTLVVVAVLPAICEEFLMRGIVLHSTEKYGYRASIIISGLWFAILHNSLQNFLGMFFLGMVACYAVWMTQSVYSAMFIHFGFNTMGLIMQTTGFPGSTLTSVLLLIASFAIFVPFVSSLNRKFVKRYKTHGLLLQILGAIINVPMIIIILGFVMFYYTL